jgi:hypothetical protein
LIFPYPKATTVSIWHHSFEKEEDKDEEEYEERQVGVEGKKEGRRDETQGKRKKGEV